tara:strand:+ start:7701 stop:8222 length:522 start_codon:yes stop_codon:yes gene_type:complete
LIRNTLILFIIVFSSKLFANKLAVVDIDYIINNCDQYKKIFLNIQKDQQKFKDLYTNEEKELTEMINEIEELKLILTNEKLKIEIDKYNNKFKKFQDNVDKFNFHYENQITKIKNNILQNILKLMEKYASDENIDVIFDSKNYIMASNDINITKKILNEINNTKIDLSFEEYK